MSVPHASQVHPCPMMCMDTSLWSRVYVRCCRQDFCRIHKENGETKHNTYPREKKTLIEMPIKFGETNHLWEIKKTIQWSCYLLNHQLTTGMYRGTSKCSKLCLLLPHSGTSFHLPRLHPHGIIVALQRHHSSLATCKLVR